MSIYSDLEVEIDEKEIARLLGYKNSPPPDDIQDLIRTEIANSMNAINPRVAFEKINIVKVDETKVFLQNNLVLEGTFISNKLSKCKYIIVSITTIGEEMDKIIQEAFEAKDLLKAMIDDHVANCALGYVNNGFWSKIVADIEDKNLGITSRLSPGDTEWPLSEQRKIFQCIPESKIIGVSLTDSNMMTPLKSTTAVYGIGEGIGITKIDHVCSQCTLKACSYRKKDEFRVSVKNKGTDALLMTAAGSNLLETLRNSNILIDSPCGGKGSCGKCKVTFIDNCPAPTVQDEKHLSNKEILSGVRLACTITINSDLSIIADGHQRDMEVLTAGIEKNIDLAPIIHKHFATLPKPAVGDQRSDYKRLCDALGIDNLRVSYKLLPTVSSIIRESDYTITAALHNNILLHLEAGDTTKNCFGAAVDIGTTTIACYLVNLQDGRTLDVESQVNKQASYGADVISRIGFTIDDTSGTKIMQRLLIEQINSMLDTLCRRNNIISSNIYNMAIAGNTTMIHFILGLPSKNISMSPFIPVITSAVDYTCEELGININGIISILPGIASYVGSDITAGIIASGMTESDKYSLLLDLGTNGEIVLGNDREILCCATAAGPAFEGANIKCGVGGVKGAINTINLSGEKLYTTIGAEEPIGICGSAVLDMVAELRKHNIVDETGRIIDKEDLADTELKSKVSYIKTIKEFIVEPNSAKGEPIVFTQKDIREVQMAKAAVASGIHILIKEAGISYNEIENVYIAGGFGSFMKVESAVSIGMLPRELQERVSSIGNSAGIGAKLYLLSERYRKKAEEVSEKARYIELSTRPDFQDYYMENMMF